MEKVVIYGAGKNCPRVISALRAGYDIVGIADKDARKQGGTIDAYKIFGLDELLRLYTDVDHVVVSIVDGYDEIRMELNKWGIPLGKIRKYDQLIGIVKPLSVFEYDSVSGDADMCKKLWHLQNEKYYASLHRAESENNMDIYRMDIAFVVPEPIKGSGGHRNIYRAVSYLRKRGHKLAVYYINSPVHADIVKWQVNEWFYDMSDIPFICYDGAMGVHDVCVATWWETAYAMLDNKDKFKVMFHFVQDNEAAFYPMSSDAILAENTYKQDIRYICSGPWMKAFLENKYGARADCFQFPVNREIYNTERPRTKEKKNILFFAKPEIPRRCYEIGVAALTEVHRRMPEVELIFFGSDRVKDVPFPVVDLGILPEISDLAELYRNADLGVVFSTTNPSLVPYEMMSCGCPVADLDMELALSKYGNDENNVFLLDIRPKRMGEQICEILHNEELRKEKQDHGFAWVKKEFPSEDEMGNKVEKMIQNEVMNGGMIK